MKDTTTSEFKTIPGTENYAISKSGIVVNKLTGRTLSPFMTSNGYVCVHLKMSGKQNALLHRLVALTYIPNPDGKLQVNHIDGNKMNNSVCNLEWVTPRENCEHAGRMGLSPKCTAIDVYDLNTGEILNFQSFIACARHYNMSKDAISNRINSDPNGERVFPEGRRYRIHSSDSWSSVKTHHYGRRLYLNVKHLPSNKIFSELKLTEVSELTGIPVPRLSTILKNNDQPVVRGYYQIKYSDSKSWRVIGDMCVEMAKTHSLKPVQVFNPSTGDMRIYMSLKECAEAMHLKMSTLCERLRRPLSIYSDGFSYGYYPSCVNSPLSSKDGGCKDT